MYELWSGIRKYFTSNGTFIVDSNQFVNGEQYGDVVAQASGINGMFATINSMIS